MHYVNKKSVGIDISDSTIEAAELVRDSGIIKASGFGRVFLLPGVVAKGRILNKNKLAQAVRSVLSNARPNPIIASRAVFGFPDSQTYIHTFWLDSQNNKEFKKLIDEEIKSSLPIAKEDLLYSHKTFKRPKEKNILVVVAAAQRPAVLEWQNFFNQINLEIEIFDIESLACFRGLFNNLPKRLTALLDIGANTSILSIFDFDGLVYSCSFGIAGNDFTQKIAKALKINFKEAEKLKKEQGLEKQHNASEILKSALNELLTKVQADIKYFEEKFKREKVEKIILLGGSGRMPELPDYLSSFLKIKVDLGKPLFSQDYLKYAEAQGLALRALLEKQDKTDLFIPMAGNNKQDRTRRVYFKIIRSWMSLFKKFIFEKNLKNTKKFIFAFLIFIFVLSIIFILFKKGDQPRPILPKSPVPQKEKAADSKALEQKATLELKSESAKDLQENLIKIKNISQKLNARAGPGVEYEIINKAEPNSQYILLEKNDQWAKIKLSDTQTAWVYSDFVEF